MKTSLKSLFALAAFGATALFSQAQTAPKILVVDMGKVLENFYRTQEQQEKIKGYQDKVREEDERLLKDRNTLAERYKEAADQAKNPTLTNEAKAAAEADAMKKYEEIRKKEQDIANFRREMQNSLQQTFNSSRQVLVEEIAKAAADVAKKKGASLLLDKTAVSANGFPIVLHSDASYEISDEVLAEVNKGRPAGAPAATTAPAPSGSAPAAKPAESTGGIQFPGTKK